MSDDMLIHQLVQEGGIKPQNIVCVQRTLICANKRSIINNKIINGCLLKFENDFNLEQQSIRRASGYIPVPPAIPAASVPDVINQVTSLGEPTLSSLGLATWYPSGFVQYGLELIHVNMEVPWWSAIVIGTVFLRLMTFPLVVLGQKNATNMHNHSPYMQQLQDKYTKAKSMGNSLEIVKSGSKLFAYMKEHKINPLKNMIVPLIQLPIFVSVFVGIRQMANLPVESMSTGGYAWFIDLTSPDPYFLLPIFTMVTFSATVELGVDGVKANSLSKTMMLVMRVLPIAILPFTINFPSGLLLYWLTSNVLSLVQVLVLKIPAIRKFLKIPTLVKHDSTLFPEKKPLLEDIKSTWKRTKKVVNLEERQRMEAIKFREAGMGAIPKTFNHDPTKK